MTAFLFADLVGFTARTQAHGDEGADQLIVAFEHAVRAHLTPETRLVKMIGDEAMVAGDRVSPVLSVARALLSTEGQLPGRPAIRAAIHVGDAVERHGDYFGHTVNIAARVVALARPCQILITDAAYQELRDDQISGEFVPLGEHSLRNIAGVFMLYALNLEESGYASDPVCRMRFPASETFAVIRHGGDDYRFCSQECASTFAGDPSAYVIGR